jgi:hypothetical protein
MRNHLQYRRKDALRYLQWKVWTHPALFLANCPLFEAMRRSLQVARGERPQVVTAPARRPTNRCGCNHGISRKGDCAMNLLCKLLLGSILVAYWRNTQRRPH